MSDFDDILTAVAKELESNDQIEALGKKLGCSRGDISRYLDTNLRFHDATSRGTLKMLRDWNDRTSPAHARRLLREALVAAKLVRIADTCLPEAPQEPTAHPPPVMPNSQDPAPAVYVTEKQFLFIATNVLGNSYSDLATALDVPFAVSDNTLRMHLMDVKKALLELLNQWKVRTGGLQSELDKALRQAQCGGLVEQYKAK